MKKVVLGLSGGVDSAVAAARLKSEGFDVLGVFLELGLGGEEAAREVAQTLGIEFYTSHKKEQFEKTICAYFADEYRNGRTPNPCVICNPTIKFRTLMEYAEETGAEYLATGHYARVGWDNKNRALLLRASTAKDQSYMLYRLPREVIARCIFPLGGMEDKSIVRDEARTLNLDVSDKPDSMDVCFIPDGDVPGWLENHGAGCPTGNFVDNTGRVLGRHNGIHCYTVGQRRGLGISADKRLYVSELKSDTEEVVLSCQEDIYRREIGVIHTHYIAPEYTENGVFECEVRIRFSKKAECARVYPLTDNTAKVIFNAPVKAPAKGQSAVFYDGDVVIGGGFINSSL